MKTTIFESFKNSNDFVSYTKDQIIFEEGKTGDTMYIIQQGEVDILCQGKLINTVGEGEIFGEMALIDTPHSRCATVIAKTDCKIIPIHEKQFLFLVQEHPFFALSVMRVLADRLRKRIQC